MSQDTPDLSSTTGTPPAAGPYAPTPVVTTGDRGIVGERILEPVGPSAIARLGAEALGTFFLVLVGVGVTLYSTLSGAGTLGIALGFGLALVGGTIALGHISGGHFNPAVTIGAAIAGRTSWRDVLPYILAQLVGGALASAALFLTIPAKLPGIVAKGASTKTFFSNTANGHGTHSPLATLSQGQVAFELLPAILIEIIATALLVGVFLAVTSRHAQRNLAPIAIGLTYAVLVLVASPITNGGLNPARSTATAIFSDSWALGQLWMFWLAPLVGAALAGLAYRTFSTDQDEDDDALVVEELVIEGAKA